VLPGPPRSTCGDRRLMRWTIMLSLLLMKLQNAGDLFRADSIKVKQLRKGATPQVEIFFCR